MNEGGVAVGVIMDLAVTFVRPVIMQSTDKDRALCEDLMEAFQDSSGSSHLSKKPCLYSLLSWNPGLLGKE
jgi:hypothetical protein